MSNVNKLPDSYAKDTHSNNYKLLNLNEQAIADIKADAQALYDILDLKNARGRTLDMYGDMLGQQRGAMTDEQYYYILLTRIAINNVKGDGYSLAECLATVFSCKPDEIVIKDSENTCKVVVETFPLQVLIDAGFTSRNAIEMLNKLLPIGVVVEEANFDGTFEFADSADVYDEAAGFANIEQTIGGYFSLLLGEDDNSPILPL
ncbi:hypothetical protein [Phascolarctobacterium sp.]|uniref:hypothetical protein n=1 Tax=Phascolarctobacterium sp. TaxID=2049039 RepID=UPI003869A53E